MATKNTTASLTKNEAPVTDKDLQKEIEEAAAVFAEEKKVKVSIPKTFEKHIGPVLALGVNGVFIKFPVDGTEHEVPETLANHLKTYLNNFE